MGVIKAPFLELVIKLLLRLLRFWSGDLVRLFACLFVSFLHPFGTNEGVISVGDSDPQLYVNAIYFADVPCPATGRGCSGWRLSCGQVSLRIVLGENYILKVGTP